MKTILLPHCLVRRQKKRLISYIFHIVYLQSNVQFWKIADATKRSISSYSVSSKDYNHSFAEKEDSNIQIKDDI